MISATRSLTRGLPAAVPLAYLAVFFAYPLAALVWRGLGDDPGALVDVVSSSSIRSVLLFTVWQAAASVVATFVLAVPLTYLIGRHSFRGRRFLLAVVTVPFVLPTVVVASAFAGVLDRFGLDGEPLDLRFSATVIIAAHAFFNIAVVVRSVGGYWSRLDRSPEDAARVLGASPWQTFRRVTVRRLLPSAVASASIVFLFTFTSFGVILLLGGGRHSTLETEIYRYAVTRSDFSTGAALAVVQLLAVLALVITNTVIGRRTVTTEHRGGRRPAEVPRGRARFVVVGGSVASTLFLLVPLATLVERSLRSGDGYGFGHYRALASRPNALPVSPLMAMWNSFSAGAVATAIAVIVGAAASWAIVHGPKRWRNLLDGALLIPIGTSAVTIGFGMLLSLDRGVLDLRQSWWIIPIAQSLIGLPFVVRAVVPVLRSIDDRQRQVAATLGASPAVIARRIDFAVAAPALAVGAGFAFAISLGEFGATSFVGRRPDAMTVPLAIGRLLGRPGETLRGQAMALSVLLMLVTIGAVLLFDRDPERGVL